MLLKERSSTSLTTIVLSALVVTLAGAAWGAPKYKVLHAFSGSVDGGGLWGSLVFDSQGDLYGTTSGGGPYGQGTVFELSPDSNGRWSETVQHGFPSFPHDGQGPTSNLILDTAGDLFGTTLGGGDHDGGVVFELMRNTADRAESILYNFCAKPRCSDGGSPYAGLVSGNAGNLFGTAGAVFKLFPTSHGWREVVLHSFTCHRGNGCDPYAGTIRDPAGNLYGTTERGGAHDVAIVYRLRRSASGWKEILLHSFGGFHDDGQVPGVGALASDDSGDLYGTTVQGGSNTCVDVGCGTVFKLTLGSDGDWKETILYNFEGNANGSGPGGGVVRDKAGNLYGTTVYGGTMSCACGVVYKLAPGSKGKWTYTVLHRFTGSDGAQPDANLILDGRGNLYGTTVTGGEGGAGVAFEITP